MLTIRKEQMRILAVDILAKFEARLAGYITEDFPDQAEALGAANVRKIVHEGVKRALDYNFETEEQLCKYVYLAFTFGRNFDKDPALPWAGEILGSNLENSTRMELLYDAAGQFEHLATSAS